MKHLIPICIALAFSLPQSAIAQDLARPVVPVEKAPFHVRMFQNDNVTMLNVFIPPGRTAAYHRHSRDLVVVYVESANMRSQVQDEQPIDRQTPVGTVAFVGYTKKPGVHQVINIDAQPFHVVAFEIAHPESGRISPSSRTEVFAYKSVLDNERVRGWRLVLDPGESVPAITQTAPGVRIVVSGGELVESVPGVPDQDMSLKFAEFQWQDPGVTRAIRNTGKTRIELVEFELK